MNALVVGGSSGIGLSIVLRLVRDEAIEHVFVVDKVTFPTQFNDNKILWNQCDLSHGDYSVFDEIDDVQALYITAGFGQLKWFQDLSDEYIKDSFSVNTVAPIIIISRYYDKLLSREDFYCAIMVSIAGWLSSPLFSVYSATKAALTKFIEAINVELDIQGSRNRILEVSPGSLKGTSFLGGSSYPEMTMTLAEEIIACSKRKNNLLIPQYEKVYKEIIERYRKDPHQFGVESYFYKKNNGRI